MKNNVNESMSSKTGQSYLSLFNIFLKKSDYVIFGSLLLLCIIFRIWFWYTTDLSFEDALITFRYAENIAAGNGFVYNLNERILGTTTPLWTLLLAGAKFAGMDLFFASKMLGVLLESITCLLMILILRPFSLRATAICTLLFATSPAIISTSISGMETSLLLCAMSVILLGYIRKNVFFGIGMALTILTRIDGVLYVLVFVVAGILQDRKWALRQLIIACLCCAPWYIFSFMYFGNILPQSLMSKQAVYKLEMEMSASKFIGTFTPFFNTEPLKILARSGLFILLLTGMILLIKKKSILLPFVFFMLLYCAAFMTSRTHIFYWYLIPPTFVSYFILATAFDWYISKADRFIQQTSLKYVFLPVLLFAIFLSQISLVIAKIEKYRQQQEFENGLRKPLGLWLKDNANPGSKVFLEPLGYIGYFAGKELIVWDEIGLVNPTVVECRKNDTGWYTKSIKVLKPDYVVQYTEALEKNEDEGNLLPLFNNNEERTWFFSHFHIVLIVDKTNMFPSISPREKRFIIFKRSSADL